MGLRLGEALNLTVNDIDSERMKVHLRACKGRKDRYVPLPAQTLTTLKTHRNPRWIFPQGRDNTEKHLAQKPMNRSLPQRAMRKLVRDLELEENDHDPR